MAISAYTGHAWVSACLIELAWQLCIAKYSGENHAVLAVALSKETWETQKCPDEITTCSFLAMWLWQFDIINLISKIASICIRMGFAVTFSSNLSLFLNYRYVCTYWAGVSFLTQLESQKLLQYKTAEDISLRKQKIFPCRKKCWYSRDMLPSW